MKIMTYTALGTLIPHSLDDMRSALLKEGHEVYCQDLCDMIDQDRFAQSVVERDIAMVDELVRISPDVMFTIDHIGIQPHHIFFLDYPKKVISWYFDNPFMMIDRRFLYLNPRHHIYSWDAAYLEKLEDYGFSHVDYKPFATNPDIYKPDYSEKYAHDVSFVGKSSRKRIATLLYLAKKGIKIDVYGDEAWAHATHPNLTYRGQADNRRECPKIYSSSKININITNEQLLTSLPVRIYDVLACEGFLLTDIREDLTKLFREDKDLLTYKSPIELYHKIKHYLEHEDERKKIAAHGRETVMSSYTFDKAVPEILADACSTTDESQVSETPEAQMSLNALWLVALSMIKFGRFAGARMRLLTALRIQPKSPDVLLAIAMLGNYAGQLETVEMAVAELRKINSCYLMLEKELIERTKAGERVSYWSMVYNPLAQDLILNDDGTVPGAQAVLVN